MALFELRIEDFRCFERAELEFDSRCTLISGVNATGKTSLLEAIHVLSSGRSFRAGRNERLVRAGARQFLIAGTIKRNTVPISVGLRWSAEAREIRLGGNSVSGFAEVSSLFPVQIIDPSTHRLLEDGPLGRRRYMDWGVFHVEQRFYPAWRDFNRALRQRNSALKAQQSPKLVQSWDELLIRTAEDVTTMRSAYVHSIAPIVSELSTAILGSDVALTFKPGWHRDTSFASSLAQNWLTDVRTRVTTIGPHRADIEFTMDGIPVRGRISRGQQKLLACILVLAQLEYQIEKGSSPATLLLDDPAAELDVDNLGKLLQRVSRLPAQVVVTALDPSTVESIVPRKRFHVERAGINVVV